MGERTILCSIDFSESTVKALNYAITMAEIYQAQVTVLFCYRLIATGDQEESLNMKRNMEANALERFQEVEKKITNSSNVPYRFVSEVGFFPSRIEMFIKRTPVTLLVMGSTIIENFNEYKNLTFDQFLQTTKVPVVIVPGEDNLVPA